MRRYSNAFFARPSSSLMLARVRYGSGALPPVSLTTSCRSAIASLKPGSPRVYSMFASASFLSASPWYARFRVRRGFLERPRPSEPLGAEEPEPFRAAPRNSANCGFFASISSLSSACMSRSSDAPYPEDRSAALASMPRLDISARKLFSAAARFRAASTSYGFGPPACSIRASISSTVCVSSNRASSSSSSSDEEDPSSPPADAGAFPSRSGAATAASSSSSASSSDASSDRAASSSDATRRPRDDIARVRDRAPRRLRTRGVGGRSHRRKRAEF